MSTNVGGNTGGGSGLGGGRAGLAVAGVLSAVLVAGVVYFVREIGREGAQPAGGATAGAGGAGAKGGASVDDDMARVQAMLRGGDFAGAAQRLQAMIESDGDEQGVRVAMAQAMLGLKDYKGAYEQYQAAIALAGAEAAPKPKVGATPGTIERNPAGAQLHFEAGTCAMQGGLGERAIEHYSTAQMLDPTEAKYPLYLGMVQARLGQDEEAVASLIRATRVKPELAEAWGTLSELELRRNHTGLALQHVEKARTLQPGVVRWRLVEARAMNRKGDAEKALALLTTLDDAARADKGVMALMAESYGLLKRAGDAAEMYAKAASGAPSDTELNYQAAVWLDRVGDAKRSRRFAEIAASLGHEGAKAIVEKFASAGQ